MYKIKDQNRLWGINSLKETIDQLLFNGIFSIRLKTLIKICFVKF